MGIILPHSQTYLPEIIKSKRHCRTVFVFLLVTFFVANIFKVAVNELRITRHVLPSASSKTLPKAPDNYFTTQANRPIVGKVHVQFGERNPTYERALLLSEAHAIRVGHPVFINREKMLWGLWTKHAYIQTIIGQELAKPKAERLQWLMWTDTDVVVMNSQISLDIFIPPEPDFHWVNLLVTDDRNGLNDGVFFIRVNDWTYRLLSNVVAFPDFKPEVELKYSEQSALEELIDVNYWKRHTVKVPQYWFNSYAPNLTSVTAPKPHHFRAGGLQIHFASNRDGKRPERMNRWMDIAEQELPEWDMPLEKTWYRKDITEFWSNLKESKKVGENDGEERLGPSNGNTKAGTVNVDEVRNVKPRGRISGSRTE